mmetsp:Transcript_5213/g.12559  ORF Transcript_5213/g.12559 Transcript_5213/m.12559 type:complete len:325 (+) Transcript_5213:137-1111(+)
MAIAHREAGPVLLNSRPSMFKRRTLDLRKRLTLDTTAIVADSLVKAVSSDRKIEDDFMDLHPVGQGSTAVVYTAVRRADGQKVALKVVRVDDQEMVTKCKQEYELMKKLNHPSIIKALDFFTFSKGTVLVLEHFDGQTMDKAVGQQANRRLNEADARRLFQQLLDAIAYMHREGVIHRDIKAQNILVSEDLSELRLLDFNTACCVEDGALTLTGTADYMPPEVLLGQSLSESSDIWAAGVCLHVMLAGAVPLCRQQFVSHDEFGAALRTRIGAILGDTQWGHISKECKVVLCRCLVPEPLSRPTAFEVLADAWVNPTDASTQCT